MCNYSRVLYSACGHPKPWTATNEECPAGWDSLREKCKGDNLLVRTIYLDSPSICPDCLWHEESHASARYAEEIDEIEGEIEEIEGKRELEVMLYAANAQGKGADDSSKENQRYEKQMSELARSLALCKGQLDEVCGAKAQRLERLRTRYGFDS